MTSSVRPFLEGCHELQIVQGIGLHQEVLAGSATAVRHLPLPQPVLTVIITVDQVHVETLPRLLIESKVCIGPVAASGDYALGPKS